VGNLKICLRLQAASLPSLRPAKFCGPAMRASRLVLLTQVLLCVCRSASAGPVPRADSWTKYSASSLCIKYVKARGNDGNRKRVRISLLEDAMPHTAETQGIKMEGSTMKRNGGRKFENKSVVQDKTETRQKNNDSNNLKEHGKSIEQQKTRKPRQDEENAKKHEKKSQRNGKKNNMKKMIKKSQASGKKVSKDEASPMTTWQLKGMSNKPKLKSSVSNFGNKKANKKKNKMKRREKNPLDQKSAERRHSKRSSPKPSRIVNSRTSHR
jgi:hypothetical protein